MIFNSVMCVWNEEDIIESTVKHLFAQGCSNVFVIDNDSSDNTVKNAINAGAILAGSFESKYFDESQKIAYLNTVVRNYNEQSNEEYIWWLYVDADEFPNIDCNLTIIDFLQQLDISVRAVQGYFFNHIPTHPPYNISSYHPADFMQFAVKSETSKIPLLRYNKNSQHLYSAGGAHTFDTCGEFIQVAKDILNIHHFKYRRPENTLARLNKLISKRSDGTSRDDLHIYYAKMLANHLRSQADHIDRYEAVESVYRKNQYMSLMTDDIPYRYKNIVRWYESVKLDSSNSLEQDILLNYAIHYLFLNNYDLALFKFNDLMNTLKDQKLELLVTIKIAYCLQFVSKKESLSILKPILKCNDVKIRDYAISQFKLISENSSVLTQNQSDNIEYNIDTYYGEFDKKIFINDL